MYIYNNKMNLSQREEASLEIKNFIYKEVVELEVVNNKILQHVDADEDFLNWFHINIGEVLIAELVQVENEIGNGICMHLDYLFDKFLYSKYDKNMRCIIQSNKTFKIYNNQDDVIVLLEIYGNEIEIVFAEFDKHSRLLREYQNGLLKTESIYTQLFDKSKDDKNKYLKFFYYAAGRNKEFITYDENYNILKSVKEYLPNENIPLIGPKTIKYIRDDYKLTIRQNGQFVSTSDYDDHKNLIKFKDSKSNKYSYVYNSDNKLIETHKEFDSKMVLIESIKYLNDNKRIIQVFHNGKSIIREELFINGEFRKVKESYYKSIDSIVGEEFHRNIFEYNNQGDLISRNIYDIKDGDIFLTSSYVKYPNGTTISTFSDRVTKTIYNDDKLIIKDNMNNDYKYEHSKDGYIFYQYINNVIQFQIKLNVPKV